MLLATVASKLSSIVSQFALATYLLPEDFALIAIVAVSQILTAGFREVGLNQQLMAARASWETQANSLIKSAHVINAFAAVALVTAAPIVGHAYADWRLIPLLWSVALLVPITTSMIGYKAQLNIAMRFDKIGRVEVMAVLLSNAVMIISVIAGAGVFSYVFGIIAGVAFSRTAYKRLATPIPTGVKFTTKFFCKNLKDAKWLMLGAYATSLSSRGDYLALALLASKAQLGLYHFGVQLALAAIQLLSIAMNQVLLPVFSELRRDGAYLKKAFVQVTGSLSLLAGLLCLSLVFWMPLLISSIWNGKWEAAIPIVQLATLSVPFQLAASPLASAILEALTLFKKRSLLALADGVCVVTAGVAGWLIAELVGAVAVVALSKIITGSITHAAAAKALGMDGRKGLSVLFFANAPYLLVISAAWLSGAVNIGQPAESSFLGQACRYVVLLIVYLVTFEVFNRSHIALALKTIMRPHKQVTSAKPDML